MDKICINISKLTDELAIEKLEDKFDLDFSSDFKEFFILNNGGIPLNSKFMYENKEYEVRCFLSFNNDEYNSIKKPLSSFQEETNGKIVPFAKDSGDNYYCLNIENQKVYYWSRDEELYYCLAEAFSEFIGYLGN